MQRWCLGVPEGYAIRIPASLREQPEYADEVPSNCPGFTQVMRLRTSWQYMPVKGKDIPAAQAAEHLRAHL